ncbi:MAG: 1-phosphofructokinase, partial [Nonomuraea sp.]|nr:1-phosphofructokinase [Nonomuraea sp.]
PAGGPDGEILAADLAAAGIPHELVPIQGRTRRTVNVVDAAGATMLNEPGPVVTAAEWVALRERVAHWLPRASVLVLSGSLPPGVPADAYATLVADARRHAVPAVVDADGRTLTDALASGPAVIKPNAGELAGVAGPGLRAGAARLREHGAQAVVASDGPNGLYADTAQGRWTAEPPRVHGGNPTGAGDAAVAALAMGLALGWDWPRTLTHAAAMSAAAVPAELAGEIDLAAYHHNLERVVVRGDAGESRS